MATQRQVMIEIATFVDGVIYPNGHTQPSISNNLVKISMGWPISQQLDTDVLAGNAQISVFPIGMTDKNVSRFPKVWNTVSLNTPTLTATVVGNTIDIDGTPSVPQAVLLNLNGTLYGYSVQLGDTLDNIASSLAALLPSATAVANVITVNGEILKLTASIVVDGMAAKEVKRQKEVFTISIFAPTPTIRDTLSDALDVAFESVHRINFSDTTQAIMVWRGNRTMDDYEKNIIYQQQILYTVEYPTMSYETQTVIEGIKLNLTT